MTLAKNTTKWATIKGEKCLLRVLQKWQHRFRKLWRCCGRGSSSSSCTSLLAAGRRARTSSKLRFALPTKISGWLCSSSFSLSKSTSYMVRISMMVRRLYSWVIYWEVVARTLSAALGLPRSRVVVAGFSIRLRYSCMSSECFCLRCV